MKADTRRGRARFLRFYGGMLAVALALAAPVGVMAQNEPAVAPKHSTQRLYLKDGSYQMVTEYHLAGDHVHYFSSERAAWEDIPMELVDLPATQKWAAERDKLADQQNAARVAEREAADAEVRRKLDIVRPLVAPGLRLPDKGYLWGLDEFQGKAELIPMVQPAAEAAARERAHREAVAAEAGEDKKTRKNSAQTAADEAKARAYEANAAIQPPLMPDAKKSSDKSLLELKGTRARRQFHIDTPTFYLRAGTFPQPAFVLVRMLVDVQKQQRRMAAPDADALAGGNGRGYASVKVEAVPGGNWLRLSFPADLPYGDYALVRILGPQQWDADVWDFEIDPAALENGEAVTAETER